MRQLSGFCLILAGTALILRSPELCGQTAPRRLVQVDPQAAGLLPSCLAYVDGAVEQAIGRGEIPGAVVLAARHGQIAYLKAFGNRSVQPATEPMTDDTIFDMSSLTKVMATVPSIMILAENGRVRLADKASRYLPRFTGGGKEAITVGQLLTHYSGLPGDFDRSRRWSGYPAAMEELYKVKTVSEPGTEFLYSDINFIALGEIVRSVSGQTLDAYSRDNVFIPLGMRDTLFRPPENLIGRIAPTESRRNTLRYFLKQLPDESLDRILRGEVHDPTAWRMGGVAGHAGLFSTAQDLAIYAQMLLNRGTYGGRRILSPGTVDAMTCPQSPGESPQVRGYGWDIDSSYSSPRGDIFKGGYGHTGFTGTSLWIHPPSDVFVIILSNRVHPSGGKDINHLRAVIANIVAAALVD
jgi:CubicO group peptidase (beta-lactamase class C family)